MLHSIIHSAIRHPLLVPIAIDVEYLFYMDMIVNSAKRLPDDKLKIAADIMLELTELAD